MLKFDIKENEYKYNWQLIYNTYTYWTFKGRIYPSVHFLKTLF